MAKTKELVRTNIMINKKLLKSIDDYAKSLEEDRSTAIRQLVKKSLSEEKIMLAVKRFEEGASFRKAAEISGLDYWEFQAELDKRGIAVTSSLAFAKSRMRQ
ncbi:MAG TPA: hypothetical protein ENG83_09300 [Nitrospirae bacterium]|nr:hypothetical protein BMS3Abin06_01315 [bacterium BMS3Abin06]HDH06098.1 hypothetical protein [Nitrospirota bacterium]HDH12369.1 hypothetical protein [Nitrospirota bacterium]HDZ01251.1 hypothetical protein [Nitrospirota bacterium]